MINDRILDNGLSALAEADSLTLCSQDPASYAEATTTYALASGEPTVGSPGDATPNGRRVLVSVAEGEVATSGTVTHWALVDTANSRLLATGPLSASRALVAEDTFSVAEFAAVRIPDPA